MSNEIISELGFDASSAIAELKKLDSALKSTDKNLGNLAQGFAAFNGIAGQVNLSKLASGATGLQGALGKLPGAAGAAGNSLKNLVAPQTATQLAATGQQVERLTTSVGLLSRIVFTQAVIKGLRILENGFASAGERAAEFQTKLAEIRTVSGDSLGSIGQLGESLRGLSDSLNIPLDKVAGSTFEAVQAQIGNGKETLDFVRSAGEFSKATVSIFHLSWKREIRRGQRRTAPGANRETIPIAGEENAARIARGGAHGQRLNPRSSVVNPAGRCFPPGSAGRPRGRARFTMLRSNRNRALWVCAL